MKPVLRVSLVWVLVLAVVSLGGTFVLAGEAGRGVTMHLLLGFSLLAWIFLSMRALSLFTRTRGFLDHILRNDYETGMKEDSWLHDEVRQIGRLGNRASEQLRIYDRTCSERIKLLNRQIEILLRSCSDCVMIADMDRMSFHINPALAAMYGIAHQSFSFESVQNQDGNEKFFRAFLMSTLRDEVPLRGEASLQFPARESRRDVSFDIIPIKDSSEKTSLALILVSPVDAQSAGDRDAPLDEAGRPAGDDT